MDIQHAAGASYQSSKQCLAGTRTQILDEITSWVENCQLDGPRVYLLTGVAGKGKSAIAHTIARQFDERGQLGSSFCFSRNEPSRTPDKLFSTIAHDLVDRYPASVHVLAKLPKSKRSTRDIADQFTTFIESIASLLVDMGIILIVIDGMDESGAIRDRVGILKQLADGVSRLPRNIRFLITSRPEPDITSALSGNALERSLDAVPMNEDIKIYVCQKLASITELDDVQCTALAAKSDGLFQWAFVACDYVQYGGRRSYALRRCGQLLEPKRNGDTRLDTLYHEILSSVVQVGDAEEMEEFRTVLGHILVLFEPLCLEALRQISSYLTEADPICILENMGSLLSGLMESSRDAVKPLHVSFREFLLDPGRSRCFHIDLETHHANIFHSCLRIMNDNLRFNICELETSYLRNVDVPDIKARVQGSISPALSYASRFWGYHMSHVPFSREDEELIQGLMNIQLLHWLEALSLLESVGIAPRTLYQLAGWIALGKGDQTLSRLATDAATFVLHFAPAMSASAPHVYLSSVCFAPMRSDVRHTYGVHLPKTVHIVQGLYAAWSNIQTVLEGHDYPVSSVAFSADGTRIASGSQDCTIRVWDAVSGQTVTDPLRGHHGPVRSVAFSPDGAHIVSGSWDKTVRVWDATSGQPVMDPIRGHNGQVFSVAFSPDGAHIVSGTEDDAIWLWDAVSGQPVIKPLRGHDGPVFSVAFSPNGAQIVSGSEDGTIRVWDPVSGQPLMGPLESHNDPVSSVAFSPDGSCVVSGSHDKVIRVWNVAPAQPRVADSHQGHNDSAHRVAFSTDGTWMGLPMKFLNADCHFPLSFEDAWITGPNATLHANFRI